MGCQLDEYLLFRQPTISIILYVIALYLVCFWDGNKIWWWWWQWGCKTAVLEIRSYVDSQRDLLHRSRSDFNGKQTLLNQNEDSTRKLYDEHSW